VGKGQEATKSGTEWERGGGPEGGSQHFKKKCQAAPLDMPPLQLQGHARTGPTGHAPPPTAAAGYRGLLHFMDGEHLPALPLAATPV
jgi:hypothetical protein